MPLDLAEAISESEAGPAGAALVEAFFAGTEPAFEAGVGLPAGAAAGEVPPSAVVFLLLALLVVSAELPPLGDSSAGVVASVDFFLLLFLLLVPVSEAADCSRAAAVSELFLPLFFELVVSAAAEVPAALESAVDFFLDFDAVLTPVSEAALWSADGAASFFVLLDVFLLVPESVV